MIPLRMLCLIFCAGVGALAQPSLYRNLHVATWPSGAEIHADARPVPGRAPAPQTPQAIRVHPDSGWVRLHIFKPGYTDTILDVRVHSRPDSYLMVHLRHTNDPLILEKQNAFLRTRSRHAWGYRLAWASLLPALAAAGFAGYAEWQYSEARDHARHMENSTLISGQSYEQARKNHRESVSSGNRSRDRARWSLGIGAALLAGGIVLSF